jgi:hypothetical protein
MTDGEYWYGPTDWDRLVAKDEELDDDQGDAAMRAGTLGLPLLAIPKAQAPLWKYRIVVVRFGDDDPDVARVTAVARGWRLDFGMHREEGSWYHDYAPVKRESLEAEEAPVAEPKEETGDAGPELSGGPEWMTDVDRQEHLQYIASQFRNLRDRTRYQTPREILESAGEHLYGPVEFPKVPQMTDAELDFIAGFYGAPVLTFASDLPPLADYEVAAIVWSEAGERASVRAECGERGVAFSMVRHEGTWYFEATPVTFLNFADHELPTSRILTVTVELYQVPSFMDLEEQALRRRAAVELWDRVRQLDPAEVDYETCIKLYAPPGREKVAIWTDDQWAFFVAEYPLGLPVLERFGDEEGIDEVSAEELCVTGLRFDAPDGSVARITLSHENVTESFTAHWADGAWYFPAPDLDALGYTPPSPEDR